MRAHKSSFGLEIAAIRGKVISPELTANDKREDRISEHNRIARSRRLPENRRSAPREAIWGGHPATVRVHLTRAETPASSCADITPGALEAAGALANGG